MFVNWSVVICLLSGVYRYVCKLKCGDLFVNWSVVICLNAKVWRSVC